jgi:hypothetical protein
MTRSYSELQTIFSAQAATGTGDEVNVQDYRNIMLQLATASSANLTIKIQGSFSETKPDFSAAATAANHWAYVAVYDLADSTLIAGATGIAPAGTDTFRNLMVNTDGLRWVCATVTARAAGSVTLKAMGLSD